MVRQLHRSAGLEREVGNLEVLDQDPPGDTVHGEVVNGEEKAAGPLAEVVMDGCEQRPTLQVELHLGRDGGGLDSGRSLVRRRPGEIDPRDGRGGRALVVSQRRLWAVPGYAEAKRVVEWMYPERSMRVGEVGGIDESIAQGLQFKRIAQRPTAEQLAAAIDVVWKPGSP